ncbi:MAG TPA: Rv3235 family protein [Pseudonocardiaceae bacterium]|nr:Rv3235 family protein [Pseudonocardiaceae bacterium]
MSTSAALRQPELPGLAEAAELPDLSDLPEFSGLPELSGLPVLPGFPGSYVRRPGVLIRTLVDHQRNTFRGRIRVVPAPDDDGLPRPLPGAPSQAEVTRLMRLVLEVLDRRRPQAHLESWVPIGDFRALIREEHPGPRRLRSVRPSTPLPGVLEVCATFDVDERARAMVGRFEFGQQEWRCTLLRML